MGRKAARIHHSPPGGSFPGSRCPRVSLGCLFYHKWSPVHPGWVTWSLTSEGAAFQSPGWVWGRALPRLHSGCLGANPGHSPLPGQRARCWGAGCWLCTQQVQVRSPASHDGLRPPPGMGLENSVEVALSSAGCDSTLPQSALSPQHRATLLRFGRIPNAGILTWGTSVQGRI